MARVQFRDFFVETAGDLPTPGSRAPDFSLLAGSLQRQGLADFAGKRKVLNIFPSVDTAICATSVRQFNARAAGLPDTVVLNVSADLPFAFKRFCAAEGLEGVHGLSTFESTFGLDYGVRMVTGPMTGFMSRAVVVVDAEGTVLHAEQVASIGQEPDYEAALAVLV